MLDQATRQLTPGKNCRRWVAGLIAENMQTALTQRQGLIEAAARNLVREAHGADAAWVAHLGPPSVQPRQRKQWMAHAATITLYRHRYEITGPTPLGDAEAIRTPEQRAAQTALTRLGRITKPSAGAPPRRSDPRITSDAGSDTAPVVQAGKFPRRSSHQVSCVRPYSHPMNAEPPTDREHAFAVHSGCSNRVHFTILRQRCSSSSPWGRDHARLAF